MDKSLSIIVYSYDEGENAPSVVGEAFEFLEKNGIEGEVVFVNDGSRDLTEDLLSNFMHNEKFKYLKHLNNMGIGAAIKTGLGRAGMTWVTAIPGDGQISPDELGKMLEAAGEADLVVSRFPERFRTADDVVRRVFSVGFHLSCQLVMGGGWGMDGVWLSKTGEVSALPVVSRSFVANIEIPLRLIRAGARWKRVDLKVRRRTRGRSKIFSFGRIVGVGGEILTAGYAMKFKK